MTGTVATQVKAIAFDRDIERLTEGFTGREWVFEEIDRWLQQGNERFFILTGEPGIGKSAIAAQLTQARKDIAAYHFCIARQISTVEPNNVLLSLAAQLIKYFPDYGEALVNTVKPLFLQVKVEINIENIRDSVVQGVVIENLHIHYPKQALDIVLRQALAALPNPPKKPVSILIDSLDEAVTYSNENNLVTLLSSVDDLPSWVRFILTSRPDKQRVLSYFETLKPYYYHLNELSEKNKEDIHQYVDGRVLSEPIQAQIQRFEIQSEALINQITELSQGNFLYTKVLLDDIELGGQPIDNLAALPKSLNELYHNFLLRLKAEWEGKYQPIFGILTVTKAPVTEEELANLLSEQLDETELGQRLRVVQQFLDVVQNDYAENSYALFHQSLQDYLVNKKKSGVFYCSPKDGHQKIIAYYLQYHPNDWQKCDEGYGLQYLVAHLADLAKLDKPPVKARNHIKQIREILLNFSWLQKKLEITKNPFTLILDFELCSDDKDLALVKEVIRMDSHGLTTVPNLLWNQLYGRLMSQRQPSSAINELLTKYQPQLRLCTLTQSLYPPGKLIRTFEHSSPVKSIDISSDGEYMVSASSNTIKVWNLNSGQLVKEPLLSDNDNILTVEFIGNSHIRTVSSHTNLNKDWNINTGAFHKVPQAASNKANSNSVTINGKYEVSVSSDNYTLNIFDLNSGNCLGTFLGHTGKINDIIITPNGQFILSGSVDGTIKLWNLQSVDKHDRVDAHTNCINSIAVIQNSNLEGNNLEEQFVVTASDDEMLKLWDLRGKFQKSLVGHDDLVTAIAVIPNSQQLISASGDNTLRHWDVQTGNCLKIFEGHSERVNAVAISPNDNSAVSASDDGTLRHWDVQTGNCLKIFEGHNYPVNAVAITPDGNHAVSASDDGTLRLWCLASVDRSRKLGKHLTRVTSLIILGNGQSVLSASADRSLKVWDLKSQECQWTLNCADLTLNSAEAKPNALTTTPSDGIRIIAGLNDGFLLIWKLGSSCNKAQGHTNKINSVVLIDEQHFVSISDDYTLKVWNLNLTCLTSWMGESELISCAVTQDKLRNKVIAIGEKSGRVHFLKLEGEFSSVNATLDTN